jgi:hypothetical protein
MLAMTSELVKHNWTQSMSKKENTKNKLIFGDDVLKMKQHK